MVMWIYIFYLGDNKNKNTDILEVDSSTCERIRKDIREGKPVIEIYPGESSWENKKGHMEIIAYTQYIIVANVCKIIIDDIN